MGSLDGCFAQLIRTSIFSHCLLQYSLLNFEHLLWKYIPHHSHPSTGSSVSDIHSLHLISRGISQPCLLSIALISEYTKSPSSSAKSASVCSSSAFSFWGISGRYFSKMVMNLRSSMLLGTYQIKNKMESVFNTIVYIS